MDGEVKELLLEVGASTLKGSPENGATPAAGDVEIVIPDLDGKGNAPERADLFEAGAALIKSGQEHIWAERFALNKVSAEGHLYARSTSCNQAQVIPTEDRAPEVPRYLFRPFKTLAINKLSKSSIKSTGETYPIAGVTARGVGMTSEQLRGRLGVRDGGDVHIFACPDSDGQKMIIASTRL